MNPRKLEPGLAYGPDNKSRESKAPGRLAKRLGLPLPHHFTLALQRYRYARRVFIVPPWKELFGGDAERRHSFEGAEAEYRGLLRAYAANGYEIVLLPMGTVAERASFMG